MILSMPVVVAPDHVQHDVATGVWCGVTEASDELPVRAEIIAAACAAAGASMVEAVDHGLDALLRVHDSQFLTVLQTGRFARCRCRPRRSEQSPLRHPRRLWRGRSDDRRP